MIVIEGPDFSGKTTVAKQLAEEILAPYIKWDVPLWIKEEHSNASAITFYNLLVQYDYDIVLDRGFLSNYIYDKLFNRDIRDYTFLERANEKIKPKIIGLMPTLEVMMERSTGRSDDLVNKKDFEKLRNLYSECYYKSQSHGQYDVRQVNVDINMTEENVFATVLRTLEEW